MRYPEIMNTSERIAQGIRNEQRKELVDRLEILEMEIVNINKEMNDKRDVADAIRIVLGISK